MSSFIYPIYCQEKSFEVVFFPKKHLSAPGGQIARKTFLADHHDPHVLKKLVYDCNTKSRSK